MPSKRDILQLLNRDELLVVIDRFELSPPDRRAKDGLVDTVAASKKATLAELLPERSRERLKELCRAVGLDDGGREKSILVERLTGARPSLAPSAEATAPSRTSTASAKPSQPVELPSDGKLTVDRLEGYLWSAADILRGSIEAPL